MRADGFDQPDRRHACTRECVRRSPLTSAFYTLQVGISTRFVLLFAWLTLLLPVWCFSHRDHRHMPRAYSFVCGVFQRLSA